MRPLLLPRGKGFHSGLQEKIGLRGDTRGHSTGEGSVAKKKTVFFLSKVLKKKKKSFFFFICISR